MDSKEYIALPHLVFRRKDFVNVESKVGVSNPFIRVYFTVPGRLYGTRTKSVCIRPYDKGELISDKNRRTAEHLADLWRQLLLEV